MSEDTSRVPEEPAIEEETPDLYGAFPRLTDGQIGVLADRAQRCVVSPGQVLMREGEPCEEFLVVVDGSVAIVAGHGTPQERVLRVHGPGRFLGELGLLKGQRAFLTAVAREKGEVLAMPVERLRALVSHDPVLGDLILRAYLGRRELLVGLGAGFRILGSRYSPDTRRLREFAARNRLPHRWIDLETDEEAESLLRRFSVAPEETPVVVWRDHRVLRNPSNATLAGLIGLPVPEFHDAEPGGLLIVGSGPAGLAAAVYGASEGLSTTVVDALATGGQAGTSARIENYLGFPAGISGGELAERAVVQSHKFGVRFRIPAEATALKQRDGHYAVTFADSGEFAARSVLLATGAHYRRLDVPGMARLEGSSVFYAATVYEAQRCRMDPVAVVGGGNSAGQAVMFLAEYVPLIRLLVRDEELGESMSRYLVDQVQRHPKVEVRLNTEVREVLGDQAMEGVVVVNNRTGARQILDASALFLFIGAEPCTGWLSGTVALDSRGFILTGAPAQASSRNSLWQARDRSCLLLETSLPGVFAAGDVRSGSVKRVGSAVGEGAMALQLVHEHLGHTTAAGTS